MPNDITAITEITRDLAYRQLDAHLQSSSGYDSKTIGVIAFDVAGLAGVLAAKDAFGGRWWVGRTWLADRIGGRSCGPLEPPVRCCPDPGTFYEDTNSGSEAEANIALVTELTGSLQSNDRALRWKATAFLAALTVTIVTSAIAAVSLQTKP